jgi:hypothetical protein
MTACIVAVILLSILILAMIFLIARKTPAPPAPLPTPTIPPTPGQPPLGTGMKLCPQCAMEIPIAAKRCGHCTTQLA